MNIFVYIYIYGKSHQVGYGIFPCDRLYIDILIYVEGIGL